MFTEITDELAKLKDLNDLKAYIKKIWTYQDKCAVVDFAYREIKFAFDLVPAPDGMLSIDLVQREYKFDFRVTVGGDLKKDNLAHQITLFEAIKLVIDRARLILAAIKRYYAVPAQATRPSFVEPSTTSAKSKKVGVITLPFNHNIGGNLQGYGLIEVLKQLGHHPVLINRKHPPKDFSESLDALETDKPKPLLTNNIGLGANSPNNNFINRHIASITRPFYSSAQLRRNINAYEFDAVIAGSDQVWRPIYARSLLPDLFLDFLSDQTRNIRRISYAASFGAPIWEFSDDETRMCSDLAGRFDAVSVREDSAVILSRNFLGLETQHVLDPTLLLTADHYANTFDLAQRQTTFDRVAIYILDGSPDKNHIVERVTNGLGLPAYTTDGLPFDNPSREGSSDKTVENWLASFYGASFVITDSFHGVVFSILFNKPFIAYGNPKRGLARFTSLLKMFGLEDRLIINSRNADLKRLMKPFDWTEVNTRLKDLRSQSLAFLVSALSDLEPVLAPRPSGAGHGIPTNLPFPQAHTHSVVQITAARDSSSNFHPLNVLCTGCGVCVSESGGALRMGWNAQGFLAPEAVKDNVPTSVVRVCPFNPRPEKLVEDEDALARIFLPNATKHDHRAGNYIGAYIGFSRSFRPTSSSGGIATYVFDSLLKRGEVDYLFVVESDGTQGYRYGVFKRTEDIRRTSKTRYFPVSLDGLFDVIDQTEGKVAVSGVACFIKAIRLKQFYRPEYREKIPFMAGIICGGLKSRWYTDFLAQSANIHGPFFNPEYRVKNPQSDALDYSFSALDAQSKQHSVKMRQVGDMWGTGLFKARACDFCSDVLTELADISVGDAWLPKYKPDGMGNSVVITRSTLANRIIVEGIEAGDLVMTEVPIQQIVQSQGGGFNHKRDGLPFRVWMANYFSDLPVPFIRARLMKRISVPEALIQINRERTRAKSIQYWAETRNVSAFKRRMKASLRGLKAAMSARNDDSARPIVQALSEKHPENIRFLAMPPILRWLMQHVGNKRIQFGLFRAALLESAVALPTRPLDVDQGNNTIQTENTITSATSQVAELVVPAKPLNPS